MVMFCNFYDSKQLQCEITELSNADSAKKKKTALKCILGTCHAGKMFFTSKNPRTIIDEVMLPE